jgi:hypothetical protein
MMKSNKSNNGSPAAVERYPMRYDYQGAGIQKKMQYKRSGQRQVMCKESEGKLSM